MIKYGIKKVFTVDSCHLKNETISEIKQYICDKNEVYDEIFSKLSMSLMDDNIIIAISKDMFDPDKNIDEELENYSDTYEDLFVLMKIAAQNNCDWICICD